MRLWIGLHRSYRTKMKIHVYTRKLRANFETHVHPYRRIVCIILTDEFMKTANENVEAIPRVTHSE